MNTTVKFFLSHSSKDKPIAWDIHDRLVGLGFECWLDENEIQGGDSITDKLEEGLLSYDIFVLLLSKNSVNSKWVREEYRAAVNRRVSSDDKVIVPVLVEGCEVPMFLADYKHFDIRENGTRGVVSGLLDTVLSRNSLIQKYRTVNPGKCVFGEASLDVSVQTIPSTEHIVVFEETLEIIALEEVKENYKKLEYEGQLERIASTSPGRIETEDEKPGSVFLRLWHTNPIAAGKRGILAWSYALRNEFRVSNDWTYSIDAPTRQFSSTWRFSPELAPRDGVLFVDHMRTLSKIETYHVPAEPSDIAVTFKFHADQPPYRDWFRFHWK